MSCRVLLATVLLGGSMASLHAAPLLFGTFNISGNITVSNPGFNGCALTTACITWTDPPATTANKVDIAGSGLSGAFIGLSGNDAANISNLTTPPEIVGPPGFTSMPFMSFNSLPAGSTTLLINFIFPGLYTPFGAGCGSTAVGATCTPTTPFGPSLFSFVNNPGGPSGAQATATWVFTGVTSDGLSTWTGNFTSQFNVPTPTVLAQLAATGSVTNSFSATFTVSTVPEAGTMSLLGLGLVAFSMKLRRRA